MKLLLLLRTFSVVSVLLGEGIRCKLNGILNGMLNGNLNGILNEMLNGILNLLEGADLPALDCWLTLILGVLPDQRQ